MTEKFRTESDSMGEFQVPIDAKFGASTARATDNFPISNLRFSRVFIRSLGEIKKACAVVNEKNNLIDSKLSKAIVDSAQEVIDGKHDKDFVVDIFQTGSGTSTNMNINEVIANLATEKIDTEVHPNDHVNMSQSSNDVIPTATNLASLLSIKEDGGLLTYLNNMNETFNSKAKDWAEVYKNGRTHLMDATPVTLGQEFEGYANLIESRIRDIENSLQGVSDLPIGGTAVGSGINAPNGFGSDVAGQLQKALNINFQEADNHFSRQGSRDEIVQLSGTLKTLASSLFKISNDIRWMGSGPISGLNELKIPALQPGSSIMPGKVNPVIPEMMMQVCAQVIGNDVAVTFSGTNGNFELNTMLPVMAHNVLESIELLTNAIKVFNEKLLIGLEPNTEKMESNTQKNPILVTALVPKLGYDTAAEIAKESMSTNKTIKEVLLERELLSESEIDDLLNLKKLI
ncbi:MAG: class II fumarate hydratase [Candidatus Actinomarinales bacterium]|nr:class II fumarate hydratase [Candidatus Actinomarinales bacterium]